MMSSKKRWNLWLAIGSVLLALLLLFVVFPLVLILYKSVLAPGDGGFTLQYFQKFFSKKYYWSTIINSFKVTVCSTILSVMIGMPLAYLMRSTKIAGERILNLLIIISYVSPPFIGAYAWIQLLGRNGLLTKAVNFLFQCSFEGIYGFAGIVLVFSLQTFPLVYLYVSGALKNMDNSFIEAAESLGCVGIRRMWQIIVPLIMPTLLASALLVFIHVFCDFGTPMLIGEGYRTFPTLLYNQFMGEVKADDNFAAALCVLSIFFIMVLLMLQKLLAKRWSFSMSSMRPLMPKKKEGIQNILIHGYTYLVIAFALIPQVTVIVTSFMEIKGGVVYTGVFSLDNYKNVLLTKDNTAIFNTYKFGLCAIILVLIVGVLTAYLTARKPSWVSSGLDMISMLPFVIPGTVLSIAFLYAFNKPPVYISGTAVILIIALAIRRMPYTIRSSNAIIAQISPSMEEASVSLGASEWTTFFQIILPMMAPGVMSGAVMSWITIICELSASIILYTTRTRTLAVAVYSEVVKNNYGNAAVYATILTLTSVISLALFFKVSGKQDISI